MNTSVLTPSRIGSTSPSNWLCAKLAMLGAWLVLLPPQSAMAATWQEAQPNEGNRRCVIIEVFVDQTRELDQQVESDIKQFARQRDGMLLAVRKLQAGEAGSKRLGEIVAHFKIKPDDRPLIYCMNQVIHGLSSTADYQRALEEALQLEVFVRDGCSRCTTLKRFLPSYVADYPALRIVHRDIAKDRDALRKLDQLVARHQRAAASVPVIHVCDQLLIGLSSEQTSRNQLDNALQRWTKACPKVSATSEEKAPKSDPDLTLQHSSKPATPWYNAVSGVTAPLPFSSWSLSSNPTTPR